MLEPGVPAARELAGGEAHSYRVSLAAGQFLQVLINKQGVDVVVRVFGPDAQQIAELDNAVGPQGPERVSLVAAAAGDYRLEVRPAGKGAARGRYDVAVEELRPAAPQDRSRVAAQYAAAEAEELSRQPATESRLKAVEKYTEALRLFRALGDRQKEALTLYNIGWTYYWRLEESQKGLDFYHQALALLRALNDRQWEANVLNQIGIIYKFRGESEKALEYYNQALRLRRDLGNRAAEALTLDLIGQVYNVLGENQKALSYHGQALQLQQALGDQRRAASVLNNIAIVHKVLGDWPKALDYYSQALEGFRAAGGDERLEAITLGNMGNLYERMGEYQKALDHHRQALALFRRVNNVRGQANVLNGIGWSYWQLGETERALEHYNQALPLARSISDQLEEATILNNIGLVYAAGGDKARALDYYNKALPRKRAGKDRWGEAYTLLDIGTVYWLSGERQEALAHYGQALAIKREIGDRQGEAETLTNIGLLYGSSGDQGKALEYYGQALRLQREVGDRRNEATTLLGMARAYRDRGALAEARASVQAALEIVETLRTKVASQDLRAAFLASNRNTYEFYIDLLMRLHEERPGGGHAAEALVASERARARSLLEILSEARAGIRQGADPALLERERAVQLQLNARAEGLTRLLSGKHTDEQARSARQELDSLLAEYQQVQAQIRTTSPRYAALTQPQPLGLKEIQQQVLDPDTLLLEYSLGEGRSFLWAVTPASVAGFELPGRAEIEAAARQVYDLLTTRNKRVPGETPPQKLARVGQARAAYPAAAARLSRMLLGPVAAQLGQKRLLIVSEGALQYIPFGALPAPAAGRRAGVPLIADHEVVSLPSASVLALLRRDLAGRGPAQKLAAVLADPVFEGDDPRVRLNQPGAQENSQQASPAPGREADAPAEVERSARESGVTSFTRLRFSRQEAEAITSLVSGEGNLKAVDFAANRATATSPDLGQYRIVHFATHVLLNSRHPELSGIVLSLVDKQGRPQDGFLRLHDVYNLKLGADLVALSACQTALGQEIKGEGLVGLTRGFMYAGAPRVLASLWSVDDRATAELMKRFYQGVLGKGLTPAAALRAAQVALWREQGWSDPFYWGGFVLQGEWK